MTLIRQLRDFFSAYDRLFTDLNRACSCLTEGQAFLVTCDGEFTSALPLDAGRHSPVDRLSNHGRRANTVHTKHT